jgi:hypothetical protein
VLIHDAYMLIPVESKERYKERYRERYEERRVSFRTRGDEGGRRNSWNTERASRLGIAMLGNTYGATELVGLGSGGEFAWQKP